MNYQFSLSLIRRFMYRYLQFHLHLGLSRFRIIDSSESLWSRIARTSVYHLPDDLIKSRNAKYFFILTY